MFSKCHKCLYRWYPPAIFIFLWHDFFLWPYFGTNETSRSKKYSNVNYLKCKMVITLHSYYDYNIDVDKWHANWLFDWHLSVNFFEYHQQKPGGVRRRLRCLCLPSQRGNTKCGCSSFKNSEEKPIISYSREWAPDGGNIVPRTSLWFQMPSWQKYVNN